MEANVQYTGPFAKLLSESEFNRFGLICVILTIVGCLGGAAVGLGAIGNTLALITVIVPTMITLSLLLAVSPMKWILTAATISVSIDVLMILYYTILA
jgi:hypothetical protein